MHPGDAHARLALIDIDTLILTRIWVHTFALLDLCLSLVLL